MSCLHVIARVRNTVADSESDRLVSSMLSYCTKNIQSAILSLECHYTVCGENGEFSE